MSPAAAMRGAATIRATLLAREGDARPISEDRASFDIAADLPTTISPPLAAIEPSVTLELREDLASLQPE